MEKNEYNQNEYLKYWMAIGIFFLYMTVTVATFFRFIQKDIEHKAEEAVRDNVAQQSYHFRSIMEIQFAYLEAVSEYLGEQEELISRKNIDLIRSLASEGTMEMIAIITEDGVSHYGNGQTKSVKERQYFQDAMEGELTLSDPVVSMMDGDTKVVLGVPIYQNGEVIGVLGGSYNIGTLSHMMFEDVYGGEGASLLVTKNGTLISDDAGERIGEIGGENVFFDHYGTKTFEDGGSIDKIRNDFQREKSGYVKFRDEDGLFYLAYDSLKMSDWVLCYVVPVEMVKAEYSFFRYYQIILAFIFSLGFAMLMGGLWRVIGKKQDDLIRYARTDALTGILNKVGAENAIRSWLANEECDKVQAFFMLDIDYFKNINDVYGHAAGDEVLRQVGRILRDEFWGTDIVGRIGGDEFVVLMRNAISSDGAVNHAKSIRQKMIDLKIKGMEDVQIRCSIGISYAPRDGKTYEELYCCADHALYETKRRGRDGYTEYIPG